MFGYLNAKPNTQGCSLAWDSGDRKRVLISGQHQPLDFGAKPRREHLVGETGGEDSVMKRFCGKHRGLIPELLFSPCKQRTDKTWPHTVSFLSSLQHIRHKI